VLPSKLIMKTIVTDIVLLDIVEFSMLSNADQFVAVNLITELLRECIRIWGLPALLKTDQIVAGFAPTGDGFYVILNPALADYGPFLALALRNRFLVDKKRGSLPYHGIRVAVHFGEAVEFTDITGRVNFVGDGLNDCARLLQDKQIRTKAKQFAGDSNFVVVSQTSWQRFSRAFPPETTLDFMNAVKFLASEEHSFLDKHGKEHCARLIESSRHSAICPPRRASLDRT